MMRKVRNEGVPCDQSPCGNSHVPEGDTWVLADSASQESKLTADVKIYSLQRSTAMTFDNYHARHNVCILYTAHKLEASVNMPSPLLTAHSNISSHTDKVWHYQLSFSIFLPPLPIFLTLFFSFSSAFFTLSPLLTPRLRS